MSLLSFPPLLLLSSSHKTSTHTDRLDFLRCLGEIFFFVHDTIFFIAFFSFFFFFYEDRKSVV